MEFLNFLKISNSLPLGITVWVLVLAFTVLIIRKWARVSAFFGEVRGELYKASWPWESDPKSKGLKKYKELVDSTIVVLIGMILLAGFVQLFDFVHVMVVTFLTNLGH